MLGGGVGVEGNLIQVEEDNQVIELQLKFISYFFAYVNNFKTSDRGRLLGPALELEKTLHTDNKLKNRN